MAASGPLAAFVARPPDAVTFDFWDTLVGTSTSGTRAARRAALGPVLAELAPQVDDDALTVALDAAVQRFTDHWHANVQFTATDGARAVVDALGVNLNGEALDRFVTAFLESAVDLRPDLTPQVVETLTALRAADVRLGIVCDVGLTSSAVLRTYLDHHQVLELFDHWSFSDEVGVYKPDPAIFHHALGGLGGVEPARAVHVGDLRRTDVAGARAVGMVTVRYSGRNDDCGGMAEPATGGNPGVADPDADAVISDHSHLPTLLGITPLR
jgi:HAD superfamily hydrolase (TIGR01509 family)